jgi:hypothetical protein
MHPAFIDLMRAQWSSRPHALRILRLNQLAEVGMPSLGTQGHDTPADRLGLSWELAVDLACGRVGSFAYNRMCFKYEGYLLYGAFWTECPMTLTLLEMPYCNSFVGVLWPWHFLRAGAWSGHVLHDATRTPGVTGVTVASMTTLNLPLRLYSVTLLP